MRKHGSHAIHWSFVSIFDWLYRYRISPIQYPMGRENSALFKLQSMSYQTHQEVINSLKDLFILFARIQHCFRRAGGPGYLDKIIVASVLFMYLIFLEIWLANSYSIVGNDLFYSENCRCNNYN